MFSTFSLVGWLEDMHFIFLCEKHSDFMTYISVPSCNILYVFRLFSSFLWSNEVVDE